jgi:3-phosphoshikimate 1-carboxyvinyltransferase
MNGIAAADADLFRQHQVILTPLENTFEDSTSRVVQMWQSFGADVSSMQVDHHDIVLAQTSHLPHLLAYALIDTLSSQGDSLEIFDYAAGGLRDFSRIASSDPTMWRDILTSNSGPLLTILDRYMAELAEVREIIEQDRTGDLFDLLQRAKQARDHFSSILEKRS